MRISTLPEVAIRGQLLSADLAGEPAVGLHVLPELDRVVEAPAGVNVKLVRHFPMSQTNKVRT